MATDDELDDARVAASLGRILSAGDPYTGLPLLDPSTLLLPPAVVEALLEPITDQKGAAEGVAELDEDSLVPLDQIPVQGIAASSELTATIDDAIDAALIGFDPVVGPDAGERLLATWNGTQREVPPDVTVGAVALDVSLPHGAVLFGSVTLTDSGDIVTTATPHGLAVNDVVGFTAVVTTTGLSLNIAYYVKTVPSSTTFTMSLTPGGGQAGLTTNGSATMYTNWMNREWAWDRNIALAANPRIRFLGTRPVQASGSFPLRDWVAPDPTIVTYAPGILTGTSVTAEVNHNGTMLDVILRNNSGQSTLIYVDGVLVGTITAAALTAAGVTGNTLGRVPLTFTVAKVRTIRVEIPGTGYFPGFDTPKATPIGIPSGARGPRFMFCGDSFTEGGSGNTGLPFVSWVSYLLGYKDMWRAGSGSTGYAADGARLALIDRYTNDLITQAPDSLVIAMGINDSGTALATVQSAWQTIWDAVIAGLPDTELVIVGPFPNGGGSGTITPALITMDTAMNADANARGLQFVSPIQDGITFPTVDGVHPTAAGHKTIGVYLAGKLRR